MPSVSQHRETILIRKYPQIEITLLADTFLVTDEKREKLPITYWYDDLQGIQRLPSKRNW